MINQSMGSKDWAMLLSLSFLWGGSFFFVGVAVTGLPPLTIVTLRVAIAASILWMILLFSQHKAPKTAKLWRDLFIMGLLNNVIPFSLIVWGQTHIASGLASILNATIPLFTVVIAGWLLPRRTDDRPQSHRRRHWFLWRHSPNGSLIISTNGHRYRSPARYSRCRDFIRIRHLRLAVAFKPWASAHSKPQWARSPPPPLCYCP